MTNRKQELIKEIELIEKRGFMPDFQYNYLEVLRTELKHYELAEKDKNKEFADWLENYQREMVKKDTHGWWIILENKIKELRGQT